MIGTSQEPPPSRPAPQCWRCTLALLGLLFVVVEAGSLAGGDQVTRLAKTLPGVDKLLHAVAFFGLSLAAQWAARPWVVAIGPGRIALLLATVAAGDEIAQGFQAARHLDLVDAVASLGGVVLGLGWASRQVSTRRALTVACSGLLICAGSVTVSYLNGRHISAALRYERAGNFIEARREYRAAYDQGVLTPALLNELAWVEIESGVGDALEAVRFAERALVLAPNDPDVHDTYGWALHHAGRSADALPHLALAFQADPEMFCIDFHLGEVYLALGQTDKAVVHLRRQVERTGTREAVKAARTLASLSTRR